MNVVMTRRCFCLSLSDLLPHYFRLDGKNLSNYVAAVDSCEGGEKRNVSFYGVVSVADQNSVNHTEKIAKKLSCYISKPIDFAAAPDILF